SSTSSPAPSWPTVSPPSPATTSASPSAGPSRAARPRAGSIWPARWTPPPTSNPATPRTPTTPCRCTSPPAPPATPSSASPRPPQRLLARLGQARLVQRVHPVDRRLLRVHLQLLPLRRDGDDARDGPLRRDQPVLPADRVAHAHPGRPHPAAGAAAPGRGRR